MHLRQYRSRWSRGWVALLVACVSILSARPTPAVAALEYNEHVPLSDDFDTCAGERVFITGDQHIVGRFTADRAGRLHFSFTRNTHGTGIGQLSGAAYTLIDAVTTGSVAVTPDEATVFTQQYQSRLLRRGSDIAGDDTLIHFLSHIVISANGDVTTSIEIKNVVCR